MASVTLTGRIGGRPGTVAIEIESLNWLSYDAGYSIEKDTLPSQLFSIVINTEKGSFVWYPPEPDKPWWIQRFWKILTNK